MARQYTPEDRGKILLKLTEYIDSKDFPILEEFAYTNNVSSDTIRSWGTREAEVALGDDEESVDIYDFSHALKKLKAKQLTHLSHQALESRYPTGAIFLAKALCGLRDSDPAAAQEPVTVNVNVSKIDKADDTELQRMSGDLLQGLTTGKKDATKRSRRSAN